MAGEGRRRQGPMEPSGELDWRDCGTGEGWKGKMMGGKMMCSESVGSELFYPSSFCPSVGKLSLYKMPGVSIEISTAGWERRRGGDGAGGCGRWFAARPSLCELRRVRFAQLGKREREDPETIRWEEGGSLLLLTVVYSG